VDHFARTEPAFFLSAVPPELFLPDLDNRPTLGGDDHGYLVTMTMLAQHDGQVPTGVLPIGQAPGARCIRAEALDSSVLGVTDLVTALGERLGEPDRNLLVQMSIGYALPFCDSTSLLGGVTTCDSELRGLTQERLARELQFRIESSLRWAEFVVSESINKHALMVVAAGNNADSPVARLYAGFGDGGLMFMPGVLGTLEELETFFGAAPDGPAADLWTPRVEAAAAAGIAIPPDAARIVLDGAYLAEKRAEFEALARREQVGRARASLIVVGATTQPLATDTRGDARAVRRADFSNTVPLGQGVFAVGQSVPLKVQLPVFGEDFDGTSFAAPQVSGLAAYLWLLSPELRNRPVADTVRHIIETSQASELDTLIDIVDAYAAVLALDRFDDLRPIRRAILDVNDNLRFDDEDIELYLSAFEASREESFNLRTDFSRFDLNSDGRTGGSSTVAMDVDGARFDDFGRPILDDRLTVRIQGVEVPVNERAVTDLQVLCFLAYEEPGLYQGSPARRDELVAEPCGVTSVAISTVFPQVVSGSANLDVLLTSRPDPVTGQSEVLADIPLRFAASCGTLSTTLTRTGPDGRANTTLTLESACVGSVSVSVEALSEDGAEIRASSVATASIAGSGPSVLGTYFGTFACEVQDDLDIFNGVINGCQSLDPGREEVTLEAGRDDFACSQDESLCDVGILVTTRRRQLCGGTDGGPVMTFPRFANIDSETNGLVFSINRSLGGFTIRGFNREERMSGTADRLLPPVLNLLVAAEESTRQGALVARFSCQFNGQKAQ
jgi:hypothetical protein